MTKLAKIVGLSKMKHLSFTILDILSRILHLTHSARICQLPNMIKVKNVKS